MSDLDDAGYALADRLEAVLEQAADGVTPSAAARKAATTTNEVRVVLDWMVRNQYAHTSGNGAWTRYYAGRAG